MKAIRIPLLSLLIALLSLQVLAQNVETRNLDYFKKLSTGGSWDVVIQKGDQPGVRLESRNLDLRRVKTEVKDQTLRVYLEKGNYRNINLKVYVTFTELEAIRNSGSGDFKSLSAIVATDLDITVLGSGDASFSNLQARNLNVNLSGSGDMEVHAGEVDGIEIRQSGSGDFEGLDLLAQEASIRTSGSGDTAIGVSRIISVRGSGSGDVYYRGNPERTDVRFSGSGSLTKR
ncbi:head GIN domain-containing protein [Cyclobacterium plantarum]|uniref:head GIN domain-containing protein n=1 Tax=Cyclobacterium plantarum TaxID=2716263 RepID=UPI003F6EB9DE